MYQKSNPSDPPILFIAAYSDTLPIDQVSNYADTVLAQQISQMRVVGAVFLPGEQKPAVRVQIESRGPSPTKASRSRTSARVLTQTSVNAPKGSIDGAHQSASIASNDQLMTAADYRKVVITYRKGAPVIFPTSAP